MRPIRLYCEDTLSSGTGVPLSEDQARYVSGVLRQGPGASVFLFNERDGEWSGVLESVGRKGVAVRLKDQTRQPAKIAGPVLLFAPVKRQATDWIVEKAVELGADRLLPVITRRTIAETVRLDRLTTIAREAAAQCERLDVPDIAAPAPLDSVLDRWPKGQALYFADEHGGLPFGDVWSAPVGGAPGLLVGPEGGFESWERAMLLEKAFVRAFSFGPRILRTETACVAGLALIDAAWGKRS